MQNSITSLAFRTRSLLIGMLLSGSGLCAQWSGVTRIEMLPSERRPGQISAESPTGIALHKFAALQLRVPTSQWEREHLIAAQKSTEQLLSVALGDFLGIATLADQNGDVFAVRWATKTLDRDSGIYEIAVWDTPEYNFVILRCADSLFQTPLTVETTLKRIIAWKRQYPYLDSVRVWSGRTTSEPLLIGVGNMVPPYRHGAEFHIEALPNPSGVDLVFQVGKSPFGFLYPEDSLYVPERFPPLRERITAWSRQQVLDEIGKTLPQQGPLAVYQNRDKVLFREALIRGITPEELEQIMLTPGLPAEILGRRIDVFMRIIIELNQVPKFRETLAKLALRFGTIAGNGRFAADFMFQQLARSEEGDFSKEAMDCVARCVWTDGAFTYLEERATIQVCRQLEETAVPASIQGRKDAVLQRIRRRLEVQKQD